MTDGPRISLYVFDTGPLITLASRVENFPEHAPEIRDAVRETLELFKKRETGLER